MNTDTIVVTIKAKTFGCYGSDQHGNSWCSWHGPDQTCDICGTTINRGWSSGRAGDGSWPKEQNVCLAHVETVYER